MDAYPGVPKRSRSGSKSGSKYGPETYFIAENAGEPAAGRPPSLLFGRRNRFKNPFFFLRRSYLSPPQRKPAGITIGNDTIL